MYPTQTQPQSQGSWTLSHFPGPQAQSLYAPRQPVVNQPVYSSITPPVHSSTQSAQQRAQAHPAPVIPPHPYYPAPPPAPPGVNPQHWQNGQWRYNGVQGQQPVPVVQVQPGVQQPAMVGWNIPAGWGIPPQYYYPQQKRPEQNYWDTQLTDNGLGLQGMEIRQNNTERKAPGTDGAPPHTPWTWVPRELDASDPETEANTNANARHAAQPNGNGQPHRPPASMSYFSVPGQNQSQAQGQQQQQRAPGSQHPQPNLPPTAQYSQQAQQQRQQSHPSSGSSQQSTAIQRAHTLPAPVARQPESFTEVKELRTTFSPNIIRTPGHYRHSSRGGGGGIYSPPLTSSANPRPAPATISHAVQRSHSHPHPNVNPSPNSSAALSRQHSAPSPIIPSSSGDPSRERRSTSIAHLSHFAEEPEGMLSPLVGTLPTSSDSSESSESTVTGAPGGSGGLGHGTRNALHPYVPSGNFGYSSPQRTPPRGQRHRSRSRSDSSSGSESDSDTESESDSEARRRRRERERYSRPSPSSYHRHRPHTRSSSRSAGHGYTPQHTQPRTPTHVSPLGGPAPGPYTPSPIYTPSPVYTPPSATRPTYTPPRANPLPAPPTTSHVFATHVSLPPPQQRTPPAGTWRQKLRYGYWNRRGDFVTPDMYVVYAPQDRANPPELANYPAATEGYRDHTGAFLRYEPTRPELAESLPRQGRPPKLPYEKFVTYVYI